MTPTPEQIAKVAKHVGHEAYVDLYPPPCPPPDKYAEVRAPRCFIGEGPTLCAWNPINNAADCMDLQRRVRAMGHNAAFITMSAHECCQLTPNRNASGYALPATGDGPDDAHALFWAVWELVGTG